jgi:hypothetical protein
VWLVTTTRYYKDGILHSGDLDERCVDSLAAMKQEMAESVVAKFMEANMSKVTNKSGFLMGIIRRVENELPGKGPTLYDLPRFVRRKLEDLLEDKRIRTYTSPFTYLALTLMLRLTRDVAACAGACRCTAQATVTWKAAPSRS